MRRALHALTLAGSVQTITVHSPATTLNQPLQAGDVTTQHGNLTTQSDPKVGGWGGPCTCPSGAVYMVGDQNNHCASLSCEGGVAGECHKNRGAWSYKSVKCAIQPPPPPSPPLPSPSRPPLPPSPPLSPPPPPAWWRIEAEGVNQCRGIFPYHVMSSTRCKMVSDAEGGFYGPRTEYLSNHPRGCYRYGASNFYYNEPPDNLGNVISYTGVVCSNADEDKPKEPPPSPPPPHGNGTM